MPPPVPSLISSHLTYLQVLKADWAEMLVSDSRPPETQRSRHEMEAGAGDYTNSCRPTCKMTPYRRRHRRVLSIALFVNASHATLNTSHKQKTDDYLGRQPNHQVATDRTIQITSILTWPRAWREAERDDEMDPASG